MDTPTIAADALIPSGETGYDLLGVLGLPCRWRDVAAKSVDGILTERTMRDMLREIGCMAPYEMLVALVTEGTHRLAPRFPDPGPTGKRGDKIAYNKAKAELDFHQGWADSLPAGRRLKNLTRAAMESVAFGDKLAEVEWSADFVPVDIAPKPRTNYTYERDRSNRVTAILPFGQTQTKLPPANFVRWTFGGYDYSPEGEGCLVACYPAFYDKGLTRIRQQKSVDQAGGGVLAAEENYPPQGTPLPDAYIEIDNGDGTKGRIARNEVIAKALQRLRGNGVAKLPMGVTAKFLSVDAHGMFDAVFDRDDREMTLAFLKVVRATTEARFGSKADSSTAEGLLLTIRDMIRELICDPINGLIDLVTVLARGPEALPFAPRYEITTEEPEDTLEIAKILAGPLGNLTLEVINTLCDRAGFQRYEAKPEETPEAPQAGEEGQDGKEEGGARFKSNLPSINQAAQRGLEVVVRRHDRRLRLLVSQLVAGDIDRDAFLADFGDVLQTGHDQAYRIGWRHGGGPRSIGELSDTYLAETLSVQGAYAQNLADDILDGDASEDAGLARARQYARRMRGSANRAFVEAADPEEEFYWRLGGNEEHCPDCPELAALSPYTKDSIIAVPGEDIDAAGVKNTTCGSACKCRWERSDGREGFGPVSFDLPA